MQYVQNKSADTVTAPVILPKQLLSDRQNTFGLAQVDDDITAIDALYDAIDNLAFAINKSRIDGILFRIL